jgi:hypothetical protein
MDWNALIGALIGAGIPSILVYIGLYRQRQSADAEAFGPAVLLLDRANPDRLTTNLIPDPVAEAALLADLQRQIKLARERLLVVSAGNPRRRVRKLARVAEVRLAGVFHGSSWAVRDFQANRASPEWIDHARKTHAEAVAAMDALIEANFAWSVFSHRPHAMHAAAAAKLGGRFQTPRRHHEAEWSSPPVSRAANRNLMPGAGGVREPGSGPSPRAG